MKALYLAGACALALTAAACAPKHGPRAALDCPKTQGELSRTSVSPDGRTCTYVSREGAEVTLQLVAVQGGPEATLKTIETALAAPEPMIKGEAAPNAKAADAKAAEAKAAEGAAKDVAATSDSTGDAVNRAVREAMEDARNSGADVRVEGGKKTIEVGRHGKIVVDADDDNGEAHVDLPGIHIDADDDTDSAHVRIGGLTINAGDDGAVIRMSRSVRLRGEAFSRERNGIRATYIEKGKARPDGYSLVGYEAGGPKAGPITVAVVKARSDIGRGDHVYRDIRRLVRKNGGV